MKSIRSVVLALLALATGIALPASAAPDGPATSVVHHANDTIAAALKQKTTPGSDAEKKAAAEVTTSVRDFLDVDELGRRALVDQWAKISKKQQDDYLKSLRGLIEDNYVKGLRSNLEYDVQYDGEEPGDAGTTVVKTEVKTTRHNRPYVIKVDYVLVKDGGGKLKCFDVRTDGVGLVENYRVQFNKIIDKSGIDGLIAKMKKKQAGG